MTQPPPDAPPQTLPARERDDLLEALKTRFERHMARHAGMRWAEVQARLQAQPALLGPLHAMERSGGEPDVIGRVGDGVVFCDCSAETPPGRRSLCYDREGLASRKEHRPQHNAVDLAADMGVHLLTEAQYRELQRLGEFDTKTSSWVATPPAIRRLGGALFCDRRYGEVFTYHNGAQSYYASRGFRGALTV